MKPTKKEILKQLWKEFWLPTLVAIFWLLVNILFAINKANQDAIKLLNIFGTGFFFFSYLTGHYNRVKKQLTVEKNLNTVEEKLISLTNNLELKTNQLFDTITGGDSFIEFFVFRDVGSGNRTMNIISRGEHMMYDVSISINDYSKRAIRREFTRKGINDTTYNFFIGNMAKSVSRDLAIYNLDSEQKNIYLEARIIARNGHYICRTNAINIDSSDTLHARQTLKIEGDNIIILAEQTSPNFPRNEKNEIKWTA